MLKRVIILLVLSSILITLVLVRDETSTPVNNTGTINHSTSDYTTVEYKISKIKGDKYHGKSDDGTEIIFSAKNIQSGDNIQVDDVVLCYFEKNNLGKGVVKVEKK
jgi:hypothetical protein